MKDYENPDLVEEREYDMSIKVVRGEKFETENLLEEGNKSLSIQKAKEGKITGESTIGDVIEKYPEVIEPLTNHGIHCVGCHVSPFETLEMGLKGHGMSESEVGEVLKELNEVVEKSASADQQKETDEKVHLTQNAAERIKALANGGEKGLRIYVEKGGCSGYTYEMEMVDAKKEDDLVFEEKGVSVFVDKESIEQLKGSYVDYLDSLQGAGFKIKNPNASQTCGCGESFG
jgi:iron-sulfur cluster assembly protein